MVFYISQHTIIQYTVIYNCKQTPKVRTGKASCAGSACKKQRERAKAPHSQIDSGGRDTWKGFSFCRGHGACRFGTEALWNCAEMRINVNCRIPVRAYSRKGALTHHSRSEWCKVRFPTVYNRFAICIRFSLMSKTLILITPAMYRECCFMQRPMNWYYRTTITKWVEIQFRSKRLIWIVIFQKSGDS